MVAQNANASAGPVIAPPIFASWLPLALITYARIIGINHSANARRLGKVLLRLGINGNRSEMSDATGARRMTGILIGAAVLLSLGMGLRQSLGLFLTPVTRDLAVTATSFTLAIAIQNIVWGLSQAPVGALADRFGLRVTMLVGAVIYVVGLLVMATAGGAMALLVSGALIGIALSCTASSLVLTACARAVSEKNRSKILGIVSAAGSLGTLVIPITTQSILARHAW